MYLSALFYNSIMEDESGLPPRFSAFIYCNGGGRRSPVIHYVLRDARVLIAVVCGLN